MKKILEVEFNDFRAFNGKQVFDLKNKDGKAADFICIYGENGMGKTSFFEGIEWFSCGVIYKFLDKGIKSQLNKYEGFLLKNRDSINSNTSIKIKFSDNSSSIRTSIMQKNSKNDYSKGKLNSNGCGNNIIDTQILPHSKIDSFIYAKNPTQKYEEWGAFWDNDGTQRELLKRVYLVKKTYHKNIEDIQLKLIRGYKDLKELTIDDSDIETINNEILTYNNTIFNNDMRVCLIKKNEDNFLEIPQEDDLKRNKLKLINAKTNEEMIKSKIDYIYTYYQDYNQEQSKNLVQAYDRKLELIDLIKIIIQADECWFDELLKIRNSESILNEKEEQLKINRVIIKSIENQKEENQIQFNKINTRVEILNSQLNKIIGIIDEIKSIEKYQEIEKNKLNLKNNQIKKLIDIKAYYEKQIDIVKNRFYYKLEDNVSLKLHINNLLENVNDIKEIKQIKEEYLETVECIEEEIIKVNKEIIESQNVYDLSKKNYDDLARIVLELEQYIESKDINTCPVCRTEFSSTEQLLDKVNLDVQEEYTKILYNKLNILKEKKEILNKDKIDVITKWNELCEQKEYKYILLKNRVSNNISNYKKKHSTIIENLKKIDNRINEIENYLKKYIPYNGELTQDSISKNVDEIYIKYFKQLDELELKNKNTNKEYSDMKIKIRNQSETIQNYVTYHKNFLEDEINRKRIKSLKDIISEVGNIKSWTDIEKIYSKTLAECERMSNKIKTINYNINSIKDTKKEINHENKFYLHKYESYLNEIFEKKDVKYEDITEKIDKQSKFLQEINHNINTLDNIIQEFYFTQYNLKYKKLNKSIEVLLKEQSKNKKNFDEVSKIFNVLKAELEENIHKAFGSKSINSIYKLIEPHKVFKDLKYEVIFNNDDKAELYIKGDDKKHENDIIPEYFFSSAQLNTVALSVFLGGAISSMNNLQIKTLFIDDPVGHFDDINVLAFVDLLRNITSTGDFQVVLSTHDETFYNLLKNKISGEYYNSKFLKFYSCGKVKCDNE